MALSSSTPEEIWYSDSSLYGNGVNKNNAGMRYGGWGNGTNYASYHDGAKVNQVRLYLSQQGTATFGKYNTSTKLITGQTTITLSGNISSTEMTVFDLGETFILGENEIMFVGGSGNTSSFYHWAGGSANPTPPACGFWEGIKSSTSPQGRFLTGSLNLLVDFGYNPNL